MSPLTETRFYLYYWSKYSFRDRVLIDHHHLGKWQTWKENELNQQFWLWRLIMKLNEVQAVVVEPTVFLHERVNSWFRRIVVYAIFPHVGIFQVLHHFPDAVVALEASSDAHHQDFIAFLQPLFSLHVAQNIPKATGGGVSESVKRHSRWL